MQVQRLETAGMVTRKPDPDDARAVLIRISPVGVETLRQVRADRAAAIDPHLAQLTEDDRATLTAAVEVLRRLVADATTPRGE